MKKKFPKKISIVWFQGYDAIPKDIFKENLKNWKLINPKWNVSLLDDQLLKKSCKEFSFECLKIYNSFELLHMKIDFARYVHLYLNGGIYVDMDCYALRSLDNSELVNNIIYNYENNIDKHILGLSTINIDSFESFMFCGSTRYINNAIMMASPKHPLLKKLIDSIIENVKKTNIYFDSNYNNIQNITGPYFINKFFQNYTHIKGIFYFPYYIFEPNSPFGLCDIKDDTLAIHKFEMSWISDNLKNIMSLYFKIKPNIIIIPIILLFYFWKKK